ncbi:Stp1/IreP family PP2C-type Ser/Thr phosphatase [Holzapfeliella sp. He02]|uniref:Stp1/IreP family PP2C-type Ser/Thr phosphatase n=1 Tax=Holzapfeliella saturejae TaxID=3082953 RepID=A0ABU8SGR6_9LACO
MIQTAWQTDVGLVRKTNQDYVKVFKNQENIVLAIVADGMGGHRGGDVASSMAVNHIGHSFEQSHIAKYDEAKSWLEDTLVKENKAILDASNQFKDLRGMGTTIVLVVAFKDAYLFAHLGDSRAYLLKQEILYQVTEDHSLVNELLKQGEITPSQAKNHPQKNIITESLGVSQSINPEYIKMIPNKFDIVLLCSDGLTNTLSRSQIQKVLNENMTLQEKCDVLVALANEAGGEDNITVCLLTKNKEV